MQVVPLTLKQVNTYIEQNHRHHKRVQGHRFSFGAIVNNGIVGVIVVGRPVARGCDAYLTAEITRLCTDGTKNLCSFLYAKAARICKELGFKKIQTYILETEPGTSLLAAGWKEETITNGGQWQHSDGKPRRTDQPICKKKRYAKYL